MFIRAHHRYEVVAQMEQESSMLLANGAADRRMSNENSAGSGTKIFGVVVILFGAVLYIAAGGVDESPAAFVGVAFIILGCYLVYRGRKLAAKAVAEAPDSPLWDSKPDVLYLRSFDTETKLLSYNNGKDELADALRPFGDVIAIGRPGERLPMPGAARMYVSDAEWRSVVLDRMRVAPLVVIRAGGSQGLFWEFGQAIRMLSPERLLILVWISRCRTTERLSPKPGLSSASSCR